MPFQIIAQTYGEIVKRIARMVGHPVPVDPVGSLDPAIGQMCEAINVALTELLGLNEWQDLTSRGSITVVQDFVGQQEKAYDLPEDYYRLISQSEYISQQVMTARGPISAQQWQANLSSFMGTSFGISWQIRADKIWFFMPPVTPIKFDFMYISRGQVIDADDSTLIKSLATKNGDKFMLNAFIIMLLGRMKYLEWKGFDSSAAMRDFLVQFNSKTDSDKSGPVLNIAGGYHEPLIGDYNRSIPETGFGR